MVIKKALNFASRVKTPPHSIKPERVYWYYMHVLLRFGSGDESVTEVNELFGALCHGKVYVQIGVVEESFI